MRPMRSLVPVLMLAMASVDTTLPARAAAVVITTCGVTCTSNCELGSNIVCTDGQDGVVLANGADLDLRGFDVRCTHDSYDPVDAANINTMCGVAVTVTGTGSRIFSSSSLDPTDPTPRVRGAWAYGIDCQAKASSEVRGIRIELAGSVSAIDRCVIVEQNTVLGLPVIAYADPEHAIYSYPSIGIRVGGVTSRVVDNLVDGFFNPINRAGSGGVYLTFENNMINYRDYFHPLGTTFAIDFRSSTPRPGTVRENVVAGDGIRQPIASTGSGLTYDANTCRTGLLGCSACITSGNCDATSVCTSP